MSAKDRKGSGDKRKNNGNALAGTLFTAAMICCCVLIYLLSRGGRNTAKDTSMDIPPQPTAQMERVYPSVEVFFERAKGYGFDAEYTEDDGYAPDKGYTLKRGGLDGGDDPLAFPGNDALRLRGCAELAVGNDGADLGVCAGRHIDDLRRRAADGLGCSRDACGERRGAQQQNERQQQRCFSDDFHTFLPPFPSVSYF